MPFQRESSKNMSEEKKKSGWFSTLLIIVLLALVVYVFYVRFVEKEKAVSLFGYQLCTVLSDSMNPTLEIDDMFLSKEVEDFSTLKASGLNEDNSYDNTGDIIIFVAGSEWGSMAGQLISHRIVEVIVEDDGTYSFRMKGDANATMDSDVVTQEEVVGVFVRETPVLAFLYKHVFHSTFGWLIIIIPLTIVIVREIIVIARARAGDDEDE